MSEHKIRDREPRWTPPPKPVHRLGWSCENCDHVIKDSTPGSTAMKCVRYPPQAQLITMGQGQAWASVSPPVQAGEWCGEFAPIPQATNG